MLFWVGLYRGIQPLDVENDQPGGWLFEKGMIEQHEAVHLELSARRRGVFP